METLKILEGCTRCSDARELGLYARMNGDTVLCAACWKRAGRPSPAPVSRVELERVEVETRRRMVARGGTNKHLVFSGKA